MYLQMNSLDSMLKTCRFQTGRDISIEPSVNRQFSAIDNSDRQFVADSVLTLTCIRSNSPEPLLSLVISATDTTQLANVLGNQHTLPLYLTIGNS
jgi:hypothetical protein